MTKNYGIEMNRAASLFQKIEQCKHRFDKQKIVYN